MVQIDYEITIFYKEFFPNISLQGRCPRIPRHRGDTKIVVSPLVIVVGDMGGDSPPHPPLGNGVQARLKQTFES